MGIDNIVAGDGVGIAITGMVVVFLGLLLTSAYITLLPRLFDWLERARSRREAWREARRAGREARREALAPTPADAFDPDLLAAIAYVMDAERERDRSGDRQRITMRDDGEQGVWTAIGKMRTLSTRL
jgi:hypothetical protein